jgi:hypothetical protein
MTTNQSALDDLGRMPSAHGPAAYRSPGRRESNPTENELEAGRTMARTHLAFLGVPDDEEPAPAPAAPAAGSAEDRPVGPSGRSR